MKIADFLAAVFFFKIFFLTALSRLLWTFFKASVAFLLSLASIAAPSAFISARKLRLVFWLRARATAGLLHSFLCRFYNWHLEFSPLS